MPATCAHCGGDHDTVFLHSVCHPNSPTWIEYHEADMTARVTCAKCGKALAILKLAESPL